jgi:hypothetical protein
MLRLQRRNCNGKAAVGRGDERGLSRAIAWLCRASSALNYDLFLGVIGSTMLSQRNSLVKNPYLGAIARSLPMPEYDEQNIHHEQQHDRHLQHQHPPVVPILLQDVIDVVERLELFIHRLVPIAQVEP